MTGLIRDSALNLTDQTTHEEVSATLRKWFSNGMWISASASASRDTDRIVYSGNGRSYDTANAPTLGLNITYGVPLGR